MRSNRTTEFNIDGKSMDELRDLMSDGTLTGEEYRKVSDRYKELLAKRDAVTTRMEPVSSIVSRIRKGQTAKAKKAPP